MNAASVAAEPLQLLALLPIDRQGEWLDACLLVGRGHEIEITQVGSMHEAAGMLRQYTFDLVIVWIEGTLSTTPESCEQLQELVGHDGYIALGMRAREGWQAAYYDAGAIACLDMDNTDPLTLVNALRSACDLVRLRLAESKWQSERHRASLREAREVDRLLVGQRQLLERLDELGGDPSTGVDETYQLRAEATSGNQSPHRPFDTHHVASPLGQSYCAALQSYLFDEQRAAQSEIAELVEAFAACNSSSSSIMRLHLTAVTHITAHGGPGALRHCLAGADRFLIELLMRLVDYNQAAPHAQDSVAGQHRLHSLRTRPKTSPLAAA